MTGKGLLRITVSLKKRREHLTALTSDGLGIAEEVGRLLNESQKRLLNNFSDKSQQQLYKTLSKMHGYTCRPGKTGACRQFSDTMQQSPTAD